MAIEADSQCYHFISNSPAELRDQDTEASVMADYEALLAAKPEDPPQNVTHDHTPPVQTYPFKPNPIHDVESVWWLATRLTLNRKLIFRIHTKGQEVTRTEQLPFYHRYFYDISLRARAMVANGDFSGGQTLVQSVMRPVVKGLEEARSRLADTYRAAEKDIPSIDHMAANDLSAVLFRIFCELYRAYMWNDVELEPFFVPPQKKDSPELAVAPAAGLSLDARRLDLKRKQDTDLEFDLPIAGPSTSAGDGVQGDAQRAKRRKKGLPKAGRKAAGPSTIPTVAEGDEASAPRPAKRKPRHQRHDRG